MFSILRANHAQRERLRGAVRVTAYIAAIGLVTGAIGFNNARAEVKDKSLDIGRSLLPLKDLLKEPHQVDLSGEHAWMSTGVVKGESVKDVLDRFETHCHQGGAKGTWLQATDIKPNEIDVSKLDLSVMRTEKGTEEGSILCFVKGDGTPDGLFDKVAAFNKSHDLESFGRVRYAYAKTDASGTYVMSLWTDGALHIDKLVPKPGFEPGSDDPSMARPIASLRTGSARIEGTTYGAHTYVSTASPVDVARAYDQEMKDKGWFGIQPPVDQVDGPGELRAYKKDSVIVSFKAAPSQNLKGKTIVATAEMGGIDAAEIMKQVSATP